METPEILNANIATCIAADFVAVATYGLPAIEAAVACGPLIIAGSGVA